MEDYAEVRLTFVEIKGFQTGSNMSLVLFSAGVLEQELSALAWLGLPMSALRGDFAHVVPQSFAEGRVRQLLNGFGGKVVGGEVMSMVSNKLGDPLLDVGLESFVGEEGYLEREVELGHGGVAKVKH